MRAFDVLSLDICLYYSARWLADGRMVSHRVPLKGMNIIPALQVLVLIFSIQANCFTDQTWCPSSGISLQIAISCLHLILLFAEFISGLQVQWPSITTLSLVVQLKSLRFSNVSWSGASVSKQTEENIQPEAGWRHRRHFMDRKSAKCCCLSRNDATLAQRSAQHDQFKALSNHSLFDQTAVAWTWCSRLLTGRKSRVPQGQETYMRPVNTNAAQMNLLNWSLDGRPGYLGDPSKLTKETTSSNSASLSRFPLLSSELTHIKPDAFCIWQNVGNLFFF